MNKSLQSLFLILILHSFATQVFGQRVQIKSAPDWLMPVKYADVKVNTRQISDGFYYKLSESQSHVEKKQYYLKEIRKIVTSEGVQSASEVSATFYPSYEKLYFHTLNVIRKGQIINKLDSKTFKISANESESSQFLYNGSYTAQAILSDVRIGDEIEYSYTTEGRNPVFGDKYFCDIYLTSGALVAQYYTNLIYDSGRKLNSKSFNNPLTPKISNNGNLKILEWGINNISPTTNDNYLPAWADVAPHIQFSEYQNWGEVVKWSMEVQKNTQSLSGSLKKEIQILKEKAKGDQNKLIELATRMVQNDIRYTGIETGIHSHKPHAPSQVYAQKYGDCKDKSLLLASILQSCGIEANLVSIDTYWGKNLDKYLPSPGLFNHVVLQTKIDGKLFFIDPTMSNQGGNIKDNYFPDYGKGLITAPDITQLTDLPKSKSGKSNVFEEYTLGKIGKPSTLYVESKYTLDKADDMRASLAQYSFAELEESYIKFYQKQYKGTTIELKDSVQVIDDIVKNELTVKESYTINDFWVKSESKADNYKTDIYNYYLVNLLPDIDKTNRKHPISLPFPTDVDYTSIVRFPSKWNLAGEKYTLDRNAYYCDLDASYNDLEFSLTTHFVFRSKQDSIAVSQASEYLEDYNKITNSSGYEFTWNPDSNNQTDNESVFSEVMIFFGVIGAIVYFVTKRNMRF
jgi:transglutaminase-like putative cysteine protease